MERCFEAVFFLSVDFHFLEYTKLELTEKFWILLFFSYLFREMVHVAKRTDKKEHYKFTSTESIIFVLFFLCGKKFFSLKLIEFIFRQNNGLFLTIVWGYFSIHTFRYTKFYKYFNIIYFLKFCRWRISVRRSRKQVIKIWSEELALIPHTRKLIDFVSKENKLKSIFPVFELY